MKITKEAVVQLHYKLTNKEGLLLDSSEGREPLIYMHGKEMLIPGLEKQLDQKEKGDRFIAEVEAEQAYGKKSDDFVHVVPKANFQGNGELQVGLQIQIDSNQGKQIAIITKIEGEEVTIDMNHPLAGMDLSFDLEILNVREATEKELTQGLHHKTENS